MTNSIKKAGTGVALVAAFALGGAAVAGAVQSNSNSPAAATGTTAQQGNGRGDRPQETALTGDTAAKVRAAALAKAPGGTVERVETDGEGNAAYEAHITKADGSRITVYVDKQFNVVKVDEGR